MNEKVPLAGIIESDKKARLAAKECDIQQGVSALWRGQPVADKARAFGLVRDRETLPRESCAEYWVGRWGVGGPTETRRWLVDRRGHHRAVAATVERDGGGRARYEFADGSAIVSPPAS